MEPFSIPKAVIVYCFSFDLMSPHTDKTCLILPIPYILCLELLHLTVVVIIQLQLPRRLKLKNHKHYRLHKPYKPYKPHESLNLQTLLESMHELVQPLKPPLQPTKSKKQALNTQIHYASCLGLLSL